MCVRYMCVCTYESSYMYLFRKAGKNHKKKDNHSLAFKLRGSSPGNVLTIPPRYVIHQFLSCVYVCMCICAYRGMNSPIRERALSVDKEMVDGQLQIQLGMRTSRSFEVLPRNGEREREREGEGAGQDRLSASMSSSHSGPFGASPM